MSGIKWTDPADASDAGSYSIATVAGLTLTANGNGVYSISRGRGEEPLASGRVLKWSGARGSAKDAAEITAKERIYAEFILYAAPALRWTNGERESTATLGQWRLSATDGAWSVGVASVGEWSVLVKSSRGPTTRANNCRAAETALRGIGVPFRTEDGQ